MPAPDDMPAADSPEPKAETIVLPKPIAPKRKATSPAPSSKLATKKLKSTEIEPELKKKVAQPKVTKLAFNPFDFVTEKERNSYPLTI